VTTYRVRITNENDYTRTTGRGPWVEWIRLSKTGKAMRRDNEAEASAMPLAQAQALCDRLNAEMAAEKERYAKRRKPGAYTTNQTSVIEVVPC
jgi:hypothetical protein